MSHFAAGHIGGRGTWMSSGESQQVLKQRRSSWETPQSPATSSSNNNNLTPSKSPSTEKSLLSRMATMQKGAFGSLTVATSTVSGRRYEPHSPNSSPPLTPVTPNPNAGWDESEVDHSRSHTTDSSSPQSDGGDSKCICNRRFTEISCVSCGMLFEGRVRTPCPRHPNTIHLMDMDRCPVCRGANLTETPPKMPKTGMVGMHSRPH